MTENKPKISSDSKIKAEDTGRRIDVAGINAKATIRRGPEKRVVTEAASEKPRPSKPKPEREPAIRPEDAPAMEPMRPMDVETVEFDDSGDFAALLLESGGLPDKVNLQVGAKASGKIVHIGQENTFVTIGSKVEGVIPTRELLDKDGVLTVKVGDTLSSYVVSMSGGVLLSNSGASALADGRILIDAWAQGMPVEGKVTGVNKGGFDVQVAGSRAFCPISKIDIRYVEDAALYVGKVLPFLIERIEEGGKNIVVSHRALLERQAKEHAIELIKSLDVGKNYDGVVVRVADFGAFVDIGGIQGLIPRSEISHIRFDKVTDVISPNDRVEVLVTSFEKNEEHPEKSRVSLSLKKTKPDPVTLYWNKVVPGTTLEGRVARLESFGAFIELFPGLDGLIHISELAESRVVHPKDILRVGDPVSVRVLAVDPAERRISLSLREDVVRKKPEEGAGKLARGQKVSGIVSRIERYGVFLELESGTTALLPHTEIDLPKGADLSRSFNIGDKVDAVVIEIDAQNRVRVSSLARKKMDESDRFLEFQTKENLKSSFGTFGDLFKKRT